MTRTATSANTNAGRRLAACAIAFAWLVLQAGILLHQDQHGLGDVGDTCAACLQVEQFGNALTGEAPELAAVLLSFAGTAAFAPGRFRSPARVYSSRGPPAAA